LRLSRYALGFARAASSGPVDKHAWLEEVLDDKCLDWARARNDEAIGFVGPPSESVRC
jgi:prolyl oligopeptidase PreP (S9A serine peptidase family)